ncbi:MFS transporter, MHS family, proline/betaine transporter [Prauserella marina]|uniref:Putative proline/betaine transporter n=1 Tax=Prauserella marina TaxID=530584 RepID=A0A1G6V4L5_9PSEU|nr:MFS transporter [Prauserella marina]PWV80156.1 MHS family proline/betaine transporter-like MFS transporter [Prauserella marina]SDD48411.1 MFS transporter, MHS family, proline/betaine transporter [Prauserella marina]
MSNAIEPSGSSPAEPRRDMRRVAIAVGIGNFMEWFDWGLYGFFATIIGAQFFADSSPVVGLLSALGVFAVGFVFRPIGGFVLGPIGDKYGRRVALSIAVLLMGFGTTMIGLLPTYAEIGIWAPILLVLMRCIQGFSTGGEATGANAFMVESAPGHQRGRYGSINSASSAAALLSASLLALWLTTSLSEDDLNSWGWRLPFILCAPLALAGLYLRLKLEDTPVFEHIKQEQEIDHSSLWRKIARDRRPVLLTLAIGAVQGIGYYYLGTYAVNLLTVSVGLERADALALIAVALAIYIGFCVAAGFAIDRFGRRSVNLVGTLGFVLSLFPVFALLATGEGVLIVLGLIVLGLFQSLVSVSTVVLMVELFPSTSRASGSAFGFNFANVIFSGPGPYIAAWLAASTGSAVAPAGYLVLVSLLALPILYRWLPETKNRDLNSTDAVAHHPSSSRAKEINSA